MGQEKASTTACVVTTVMTHSLSDAPEDLIFTQNGCNDSGAPTRTSRWQETPPLSLVPERRKARIGLCPFNNSFPVEHDAEVTMMFPISQAESCGELVPGPKPLGSQATESPLSQLPAGPPLHWIWQSSKRAFGKHTANHSKTTPLHSFLEAPVLTAGCLGVLSFPFLPWKKKAGERKGKAEIAWSRKSKKCLHLGCWEWRLMYSPS